MHHLEEANVTPVMGEWRIMAFFSSKFVFFLFLIRGARPPHPKDKRRGQMEAGPDSEAIAFLDLNFHAAFEHFYRQIERKFKIFVSSLFRHFVDSTRKALTPIGSRKKCY